MGKRKTKTKNKKIPPQFNMPERMISDIHRANPLLQAYIDSQTLPTPLSIQETLYKPIIEHLKEAYQRHPDEFKEIPEDISEFELMCDPELWRYIESAPFFPSSILIETVTRWQRNKSYYKIPNEILNCFEADGIETLPAVCLMGFKDDIVYIDLDRMPIGELDPNAGVEGCFVYKGTNDTDFVLNLFLICRPLQDGPYKSNPSILMPNELQVPLSPITSHVTHKNYLESYTIGQVLDVLSCNGANDFFVKLFSSLLFIRCYEAQHDTITTTYEPNYTYHLVGTELNRIVVDTNRAMDDNPLDANGEEVAYIGACFYNKDEQLHWVRPTPLNIATEHEGKFDGVARGTVEPQSKICAKCGQRKVLSEFYNDAKNKDGKKTICINCISMYKKQQREKQKQEEHIAAELEIARIDKQRKEEEAYIAFLNKTRRELYDIRTTLCSIYMLASQ